MRQETRFVTDALDGSASLVAHGVARALQTSYDTSAALPERLRDLAYNAVEALRERGALAGEVGVLQAERLGAAHVAAV